MFCTILFWLFFFFFSELPIRIKIRLKKMAGWKRLINFHRRLPLAMLLCSFIFFNSTAAAAAAGVSR